ncbi:uncharacterized protein LOC123547324 [Mercenaria mercenaria]|uniref:uncharacterized protein LOC123547324 n=1 Tax=Mercenaria mercenaria TaxID=6596 RepID=UPI00234E6CBA|nr:uncharacterized protein LOC123547324 [Mercenaria mercenaria]
MAASKTSLCAPCESRGTSLKAVKYCETCREPLCKHCAELHKAFKATKNHKLVKSGEQQSLKITCDLDNFQMCAQHPNKQTEFYCGDHSLLLCSLCLLKSEAHKHCNKVVEMEIAGKAFTDSQFTNKIRDACLKNAESAESTITEIKAAKAYTSDSLKVLRSELESVRSKMLDAFDRQTNHIIQVISGDLLHNSSTCDEAFHDLRSLANMAVENENAFENIINNGAAVDVFRGAFSILRQCKDFKKEIEQIKRKCSRLTVTFEKSDLVNRLEKEQNPLLFCKVEKVAFENSNSCSDQLNLDFKQCISKIPNEIVNIRMISNSHELVGKSDSVQAISMPPAGSTQDLGSTRSDAALGKEFGEVKSFQKQLPKKVPVVSSTSPSVYKLSYCRGFHVELSDDRIPWFSGIVCLPDERLILSDCRYSRIIMVRNTTCVAEKNIQYIPGNLTLFNDLLAVCLMKTNKVFFMKIGEDYLIKDRCIQTRFHPKCLQAVDDHRILVSCQDREKDWYLDIITIQGLECRTAGIKLNGFYDGFKLAVQHCSDAANNFRIIQYCGVSDRLQCFNQDGGSFLFRCNVDRISSVLTNSDGYIFVIRYTGEIQVLSPDGTFVTGLHRSVMHKAYFAAFNDSMNKLYVTTYKSPLVHVVDVKRNKQNNN